MGTQTYKTSESFSADGSGRATAARATSANSIHLSSKRDLGSVVDQSPKHAPNLHQKWWAAAPPTISHAVLGHFGGIGPRPTYF